MKIRFIQPSQLDEKGNCIKYSKLLMPSLTMPTLAALTPEDIEVGITDDYVEDVDFNEQVDIVSITAMTCQAPRAYQIADEFRKRNVKTIMGGVHVSMCAEEALEHCDSVLVGEAENLWEEIIADAERNDIKRYYRAKDYPDLSRLAIPRYDLLDFNKYVKPPFSKTPCIPIQATRGCPHKCDFCSVHPFLGHRIRKKPLENVVREIEKYNPSLFFFSDDNIGADPVYARELLRAVSPLKTRWACFMSTDIIRYPDLLELAAKAGCHETFIGVESINEESLKAAGKGFNKVDEYKELFKQLKKVGILSQASFVFGLSEDTPDSLKRTVDIAMGWGIKFMYIFIVGPLPGTKFYENMEKENRILNRDWSLYDGLHSLLDYKKITPEELMDIVWESYEKFYSLKHIWRMAKRFSGEYLKFFPRTNLVEDIYFQMKMRNAVRNKTSPLLLGLELKD